MLFFFHKKKKIPNIFSRGFSPSTYSTKCRDGNPACIEGSYRENDVEKGWNLIKIKFVGGFVNPRVLCGWSRVHGHVCPSHAHFPSHYSWLYGLQSSSVRGLPLMGFSMVYEGTMFCVTRESARWRKSISNVGHMV